MSMEYRELLLEIGCEELPASWIPGLEAQLAGRLTARLQEARIDRRTPVRTFVAPRRLVATVAELAERQSERDDPPFHSLIPPLLHLSLPPSLHPVTPPPFLRSPQQKSPSVWQRHNRQNSRSQLREKNTAKWLLVAL